jgi:general secretion pathway protein J
VTNSEGFTLIEVLIALAITAFVSTIAYTSLSTVLNGAERTQESAERSYQINRALMILSRDIEQFVARPVRDEFGELEPALQGGPAARFALSFTRAGWHNPQGHPRSNLQRVNYRVEEDALWRDSYPVLDRAGDTVGQEVKLLDGVEDLELAFLDSLAGLQGSGRSTALDTRNWSESWVQDPTIQDEAQKPPMALEIRLQLSDWGELRRMYALPPL